MPPIASTVPVGALPETGFLRITDIVGRKATEKAPAVRGIYPVSRSTWWAGVRAGRYPQPVRIGERCTAWRVEDLRALIQGAQSAKAGS
jgi:prophage regulatory protein